MALQSGTGKEWKPGHNKLGKFSIRLLAGDLQPDRRRISPASAVELAGPGSKTVIITRALDYPATRAKVVAANHASLPDQYELAETPCEMAYQGQRTVIEDCLERYPLTRGSGHERFFGYPISAGRTNASATWAFSSPGPCRWTRRSIAARSQPWAGASAELRRLDLDNLLPKHQPPPRFPEPDPGFGGPPHPGPGGGRTDPDDRARAPRHVVLDHGARGRRPDAAASLRSRPAGRILLCRGPHSRRFRGWLLWYGGFSW